MSYSFTVCFVPIIYVLQSGRGVKLTTHLQLVPRPRKRGSIHRLHHTPSWHSAYLIKHRDNFLSRGSAVGIATANAVDDRGVFFSLYYPDWLWGHPTSYPKGTWGSFPGVKQQGREADHSPRASGEVKKMWIYTSTPDTPSWLSA
jgi:hypothetical protein